jgi:putative colanic acid biosynthesis glycosyltransferase
MIHMSAHAKPGSQPSISIVTVCLNDLCGLRSTYESVRAQTAPPTQWVVADGASSDSTQNWLESIEWPRLLWSTGKDGGIYQGMNKGLRYVKADYVLFLNSGDTFCAPDVLASVTDRLRQCASPPALLYGDCFEVNQKGEAYLRRARPAWWVWLGMPTTHQAMYFRTNALADGFDTRYRWSGDYDAVTRLYVSRRGADFAYLPKPLCRFHLGGRSDQYRRPFLRETLEIRRRVLGMSTVPAYILHGAHHVQGWIKKHVPAIHIHRAMRYG